MREGLPSITASSVAFARAAAIEDPVGRRLFPWAFGGLPARLASFGLVDHVALRTAAIDDVLAKGFPQLVLLGAGLDARAYRLPSLANARVFEVDHPASRGLKLRFVRGLAPIARTVDSIAADFLEDDIGALLANAGHDERAATAWVMEGVAVYLPAAVTARVVSAAAARSAPGSVFALTYVHRTRVPLLPLMGGAVLRALGEPLGDPFSRAEMSALLEAAGLTAKSDTNDVDWSRRFGYSAALSRIFRDEHLVVAERR